MSYKFVKVKSESNPHDITNISMDVDSSATLLDLVECFEMWLQACGYSLPGQLIFDSHEDEFEQKDIGLTT
jgi:hypothetical protein